MDEEVFFYRHKDEEVKPGVFEFQLCYFLAYDHEQVAQPLCTIFLVKL